MAKVTEPVGLSDHKFQAIVLIIEICPTQAAAPV